MKKSLVILLLCFVAAVTSFAQLRNVPAAVTEAFKTKYPAASEVSWKDNLTNFEAGFSDNGVAASAKFNSKGSWLETSRQLSYDQLSAAVKDGFHKSRFAEWEVKEVQEISEKGKETRFRLLVRKSGLEKKYLFFDEKGQLKREAITL